MQFQAGFQPWNWTGTAEDMERQTNDSDSGHQTGQGGDVSYFVAGPTRIWSPSGMRPCNQCPDPTAFPSNSGFGQQALNQSILKKLSLMTELCVHGARPSNEAQINRSI